MDVTGGDGKKYTLVDGGLIRNNPAITALEYAKELYPEAEEYHILSLGTGRANFDARGAGFSGVLQWASTAVGYMMDGSSEATNSELHGAFTAFKQSSVHSKSSYCRLQPLFDSKNDAEMSDYSKKNLKKLQAYAEKALIDQKEPLDSFIKVLNSGEITHPKVKAVVEKKSFTFFGRKK